MGPTTARPRLFVSTVASARPEAPAFQRLIDRLSNRFVEVASADWDVEVGAAEDLGVEGTRIRARHADAVTILGGEDVAPEFYGGARPYPHESVHRRIADAAQMGLVRDALDRGTPLLGICRGIQVLNVALGGTLIQDLELPGHRSDTLLEDLTFARHGLRIRADRELTPALIARSVHSAHHQALARLGDRLAVVATAPDGTIEAIEHEDAPLHGVQWHPEDPQAEAGPLKALLAHLLTHVDPAGAA